MNFDFLDPKDVDEKMFRRCVKVITKQSPLQLHVTNDLCLKKYKKSIIEFIDYLIEIGKGFEAYEMCASLLKQQNSYKSWSKINADVIRSMSQLIIDNKLQDKNI